MAGGTKLRSLVGILAGFSLGPSADPLWYSHLYHIGLYCQVDGACPALGWRRKTPESVGILLGNVILAVVLVKRGNRRPCVTVSQRSIRFVKLGGNLFLSIARVENLNIIHQLTSV